MLAMSIGLLVPAVLVVGVRGAVQQDEEAVRQWIKALGNAQAIGQPITSVNLQGTQVTDDDLKKIAGLKNLESLNLTRTRVTDTGLKELAGLKNLKHLHLNWTAVTDVGLKEIAGFETLEQLDLQGTQVSGVGLKHRGATEEAQLAPPGQGQDY